MQELPQHILEWKGEPAASTSTTFPATATQSFNLTGSRRPGSSIISDIRARAPWYLSDWTDAWNYRVVPATALIFFAK
jgi:boron transporter